MNSPYTDKYFTKSRIVAEKAGLNPIVSYRIFTRFSGIAALEPMARLVMGLSSKSKIEILATGESFEPNDTLAIITGPFQDLVEIETQLLQWTALPCYCAAKAKAIVSAAPNKIVLDFHARHLFGAESVALASYGAEVGGIPGASTDIGSNSEIYLDQMIRDYRNQINYGSPETFKKPGIGTMPHALLAIFGGDYEKMAKAYIDAFPQDKFVALIDYNNQEIDDSLLLLKKYEKHLAGVRTDTCGENHAQLKATIPGFIPAFAAKSGVTIEGVKALRKALDENNGEHVKLFVSSGFNEEKTNEFMYSASSDFDGIGTGSFIPKVPTATADIFEVDGEVECKAGREWCYEKNKIFYEREIFSYESAE